MSERSRVTISHKKVAILLGIIVLCMFGFSYALVPIYNVMCQALGINGKTGDVVSSQSDNIDWNRSVSVQFLANRNESIPWEFRPLVSKITLHPGENKRIAYYAKNNTAKKMTIQAIPSVAPGEAAKYLKKTECFCFTQQTLDSGKGMNMPVLFHIDPDLPSDVKTITLSYTLFDTAGITHPLKSYGSLKSKTE